ncbi:hypothetical protein K8R42_01155 [bacterium]|nr:hypothetical protein [bacterium]
MKRIKKKFDNANIGLKFLSLVSVIYLFLLIIDYSLFIASINKFVEMGLKILPNLLSAFILIFLFNYFLDNQKIKEYLTTKLTWKKYLLTASLGILSSGPIYFWYPFLADLKDHGLSDGLVSVFLYNRAIKIPLIPVMLFYFSLKFIILITILMIIFSIINGIIINKIIKQKIC